MEITVKDNNNNMPEIQRTIKDIALQQLVKATGYSLTQINGQRKYGGPPPGWDPNTDPPERGCEIFIGKVPRDIYEDELIPVFQQIGKIYEFRLMMDFSGTNRGYAFCTYCQKSDAKHAIKEINNFEIKKGRFLGVCSSVDNCRLFVGGIPKMKVRDEILSEISKVTDGVVDVIVYPSAMDKSKNRGFAFVEYENHRAAAMARRKLIPGRIQLWGNPIAVDWAEPEPEADEDIMANVRILYIRNLMLSTTEDTIKAKFEEAVRKKDCIERVKKLRDYAFVHFKLREDALEAMDAVNGSYVDGTLVEVVLAKPVDKNEYNAKLTKAKALSQTTGLDVDNSISSLYGRTLAQIGVPSRGGRGTRSAGGTKSYTSTINIRRHPVEHVDISPGTQINPVIPPASFQLNMSLPPVQLLEDLCKKSNWGSPTYQLHSAFQREPITNTDSQLFLYKVAIPALPSLSFQPMKLCRTVEEAKIYAAEYTLLQLGVPIESCDVTMPPPIGTAAAPPATAYHLGGAGVVPPGNARHHHAQQHHQAHHHPHHAPHPHQHLPPTIAMPHPLPHPRDSIHVPAISSSNPAAVNQPFVVSKVVTAQEYPSAGFEYQPHAAVFAHYQ